MQIFNVNLMHKNIVDHTKNNITKNLHEKEIK